jgi:hypothetical protein
MTDTAPLRITKDLQEDSASKAALSWRHPAYVHAVNVADQRA